MEKLNMETKKENLTYTRITEELKKNSSKEKAKIMQRFFKTKPGEYGSGDIFIGLKVPEQRKIAKKYENSPLREVQKLLDSKIHEHRLTGLIILVNKYKKRTEKKMKEIYEMYLNNFHNINNWDLVDVTCPKIVGDYLYNQPKDIAKKNLQELAISKNLWKRRIAIVSTLHFIQQNRFGETLEIAQMLLKDKQDLIHKAVGWMLREVGKKNQEVEEKFLKRYYKEMPRTMLRYAIERFEETKRQEYLKGLPIS
jgi:3-methyladenine DNA glycosylase AlkD